MIQVGISITQKLRNNEDLVRAAVNHLKAQQYKDDTKSIGRKSSAPLTKPQILKRDGTMYGFFNTIIVLIVRY